MAPLCPAGVLQAGGQAGLPSLPCSGPGWLGSAGKDLQKGHPQLSCFCCSLFLFRSGCVSAPRPVWELVELAHTHTCAHIHPWAVLLPDPPPGPPAQSCAAGHLEPDPHGCGAETCTESVSSCLRHSPGTHSRHQQRAGEVHSLIPPGVTDGQLGSDPWAGSADFQGQDPSLSRGYGAVRHRDAAITRSPEHSKCQAELSPGAALLEGSMCPSLQTTFGEVAVPGVGEEEEPAGPHCLHRSLQGFSRG